ncbi:serine hydrolase [Streptomyces sp. NPDC056169]|uniref:serine hydrolase n=1 Tax=Streptomyces sp. NPDC056169 TaxID=3345734 RepID=UPI0035DA4661
MYGNEPSRRTTEKAERARGRHSLLGRPRVGAGIHGSRLGPTAYHSGRELIPSRHVWRGSGGAALPAAPTGALDGLAFTRPRGQTRTLTGVDTYVPELAGTAFGEAQVDHLLHMGTQMSYAGRPYDKALEAQRSFAVLATAQATGTPGTGFRYENDNVEALRRVTGTTTSALLSEMVWSCIGDRGGRVLPPRHGGLRGLLRRIQRHRPRPGPPRRDDPLRRCDRRPPDRAGSRRPDHRLRRPRRLPPPRALPRARLGDRPLRLPRRLPRHLADPLGQVRAGDRLPHVGRVEVTYP